MKENIITAVFEVESEAYQAMSILRSHMATEDYLVSEAALVKREHGRIVTKETADSGVESLNDTRRGGLIGMTVGVLGGPVGMLLGYSWGTLAGAAKDADDVAGNASVFEKVSSQIMEGETALMVLVQEQYDGAFMQTLSAFKTNIVTEDAAEVADEIEQAQQLQKEMEAEARKKAREEKKEDRKAKVQAHREKIKEHFSKIGKKDN